MMTHARSIRVAAAPARVAACFLVLACAACDDSGSRRSAFPTAPTAPPVISFPTPPVVLAPPEFTSIEVGEVVRSRIENPPECVGEAGWPCRYFRLTAASSGTLTVALTYSIETNRNQAVDLTVRESNGQEETWAQFGARNEVRVTAPVVAGKSYYITMWYTFAGLEFELRPSLQ